MLTKNFDNLTSNNVLKTVDSTTLSRIEIDRFCEYRSIIKDTRKVTKM